MKRLQILLILLITCIFVFAENVIPASGEWVTRDKRWYPRGPWNWSLSRELPQLNREFNGIDFGHGHLAETLINTQDKQQVEKARLEVLEFIFSSPSVPPDEEQMAPTFTRMVWEVQRAFNWAHTLHRSLYDLFASDKVHDKEGAYRKILADYLEKPEAITPHRLDHHGKLWDFPESKSFRDKFGKFNSQIWAYHWLQAATYDVQLLGDVEKQKELMPRLINHYHGYLRKPPLDWEFMPMMYEAAPEFSSRFPEAAAIFDNLHMLHDNVDDILTRPDLYPTLQAKRKAILEILPIYLHRNHEPDDRYDQYHETAKSGGHEKHGMMEHGEGHGSGMAHMTGPRPPTAKEVLFEKPTDNGHGKHEDKEKPSGKHEHNHGQH